MIALKKREARHVDAAVLIRTKIYEWNCIRVYDMCSMQGNSGHIESRKSTAYLLLNYKSMLKFCM